MPEVCVKINGEIEKINAVLVFHSRNPATGQYNVNFREDGSARWMRLYCLDQKDAETLARNIREGSITDLTNYQAEWNE